MTNIPESNRKVFAVTFIVAVIALFSFVAYTKYQVKHDPFGPNGEVMATNPNPEKVFDAPFTKANLYYIDLAKYESDLKNSNSIGCGDGLLPYEISISEAYGGTKSDAVTYALEKIFDNTVFEQMKKERSEANIKEGIDPYNVLSLSKLTISSVKEVPGENEVKLSGKLSLSGACDSPRFENQIRKTVEQIFLPESVDIYINNKLISEALSQK